MSGTDFPSDIYFIVGQDTIANFVCWNTFFVLEDGSEVPDKRALQCDPVRR